MIRPSSLASCISKSPLLAIATSKSLGLCRWRFSTTLPLLPSVMPFSPPLASHTSRARSASSRCLPPRARTASSRRLVRGRESQEKDLGWCLHCRHGSILDLWRRHVVCVTSGGPNFSNHNRTSSCTHKQTQTCVRPPTQGQGVDNVRGAARGQGCAQPRA